MTVQYLNRYITVLRGTVAMFKTVAQVKKETVVQFCVTRESLLVGGLETTKQGIKILVIVLQLGVH